jgi:hypothetical protein
MAENTVFEVQMWNRMSRIERELHLWRLGGCLTLTLAAVVLMGAMAAPSAKELRAHTLRIVDQDGKDRIVLTAEPKVADMTFLDPSGKSRLTLDIADDHKPVLSFFESGKESRFTIGLEDGTPVLNHFDQAGRKRVSFSFPANFAPVIHILDENEKLIRVRRP